MSYHKPKFHTPSSSDALVITIKGKAKKIFFVAAILFYFLQTITLRKPAYFCKV